MQLIARTQEKHLTLDSELSFLVTVRVAQLNGCSFCQGVNLALAAQQQMDLERFRALPNLCTSGLFLEWERAALAYAEEATQNKQVNDATFEALRAHFTETEIVELTWLNAAENYFNLQAAVLGIGSDELLERQTSLTEHAIQ